MSIYRFIPSDRYITREELVDITGMSDRAVRKEINELRKHPETVIVSSSHGKGYKRPTSVQELQNCLLESRSRVSEEMEKQRILEKAIAAFRYQQNNPQLELF